jgi:hypothetical protein
LPRLSAAVLRQQEAACKQARRAESRETLIRSWNHAGSR